MPLGDISIGSSPEQQPGNQACTQRYQAESIFQGKWLNIPVVLESTGIKYSVKVI